MNTFTADPLTPTSNLLYYKDISCFLLSLPKINHSKNTILKIFYLEKQILIEK